MIRERDLGLEYLKQLIRSFSGGLNGILPFSLEFRGINVDDEMVDIIPDPDHSSDSEDFSNCFEKFSLEWVKRKKLSDDFVYLYAEYVKTLNDHELDVKNIDIEQKIIDTNREIKIIETDYEKIKAELTRKNKEKDIFKRNAEKFENELKNIMSEKQRELNDLEIKIKRETVNGPKQVWKKKMLELQRSYQDRIQDFQSEQFSLKSDITTDLCHMLKSMVCTFKSKFLRPGQIPKKFGKLQYESDNKERLDARAALIFSEQVLDNKKQRQSNKKPEEFKEYHEHCILTKKVQVAMITHLFLNQKNKDGFQFKVMNLLTKIEANKDFLQKDINDIKKSIKNDFALTDQSECYKVNKPDKDQLKRKRTHH